jgi:uncharacterized protein YbjT (DUF2867 family)
MVLVVGGTGDLGARVVRALRNRDVDVRCLVRVGSDATELRRLGAEVVDGDLTDPPSLAAACAGVETVVTSATTIGRHLAGRRSPSMDEVDRVGTLHLVDAAEQAGVERFVYVSYAGVDAGIGFPLERAKLAVEHRLASSPMTVCVVRPDAFQEIHLAPLGRFDVAAGKVAVFGRGDCPHRWVATDDVAALVAAVTVEADPPRVVEFGGPEPLTRNEAIAVAERATGRRVKRQRMPRPISRLGMRLLRNRNAALASVFGTGLLTDLCPATWDDAPLRARGIAPRSASAFIEEQAAAARP